MRSTLGQPRLSWAARCILSISPCQQAVSFVRSQSFVAMLGEFSDADLFGASLVNGKRHSDITLKMDHAVPNCNSKEQ